MDLILRIALGAASSAFVMYYLYEYFPRRSARPTASVPTSFFELEELASSSHLSVLRWTFSAGCGLLLFAAFVTVTGNESTVHGINEALLAALAQSATLKNALNGIETVLGTLAGGMKDSVLLLMLLGLSAGAFWPHVLLSFRLARGRVQQIVDSGSYGQARHVARRLSARAGGRSAALKSFLGQHPQLEFPRELKNADDEDKLIYALLFLASADVERLGMAEALDLLNGAHEGTKRRRMLTAAQLRAAVVFYLVGCVFYVMLVPSFCVLGEDRTPRLRFYPEWNWISYDMVSLVQTATEILQFSVIVVAPFLAGLYGYAGRRRRAPDERPARSLMEVVGGFIWYPIAAACLFALLELLRVRFQPIAAAAVPIDLYASFARNLMKNVLLCSVPVALLVVWAGLLERQTPMLKAGATSLVAAVCYWCIQLAFEAMLLQVDNVAISYEAYSALLAFWLVGLVGIVMSVVLSDEDTAASASA